MYGTIGILTGGGDAPGLNSVIRAVVKTATCEHGMRVIGIEDGFEGLLGGTQTRLLSPGDVRGLLPRGGTILGTRNRGKFTERSHDGITTKVEDVYQEALANMKILGIDALVVLGGEGTLTIAAEFVKRGIPVCGVPKTIDNDLACTELTFGFISALDIATEALDRLHTTAESHDRVMVLEVMGRHAGWIALYAGMAGGADALLIPEHPFDIDEIVQHLRNRHARGHSFSIVVVSEGAVPKPGTMDVPAYEKDRFGRPKLGGISYRVAEEIQRRTGFESRVTILGHVQRGGSPTALDRILATRFGVAAADAASEGRWGVMVALRGTGVVEVPIAEAVATLKSVPEDLYDVAEVFFG